MKAKRMEGVINLSEGEPDFPPSKAVMEAAKKAIDDDKSYYTDAEGTPELREAITRKLNNENNVSGHVLILPPIITLDEALARIKTSIKNGDITVPSH